MKFYEIFPTLATTKSSAQFRSNKTTIMDQHRALLYAIIIQHLEADGLELVSTIIADEFVSQFGPDQFAELEQAQSSEIIDGLADTNQTALLRLLTAYQQGENPAPPPPLPNVALPTPPQPKLVIQISTPSQKTKNGQKRNRGRRRSTMVISPSDRSRKPEQPLEPREVPDLLALQPNGESASQVPWLATDEHGVVRGGTPLALLRWACRCAWMTHEKKEEEATIAQCETDLVAYLITFTDFTTPEDLVAGLETILSQHPNEAWGLQQFLVRWLEYDFDQVKTNSRANNIACSVLVGRRWFVERRGCVCADVVALSFPFPHFLSIVVRGCQLC
jgi:hypothetical protein